MDVFSTTPATLANFTEGYVKRNASRSAVDLDHINRALDMWYTGLAVVGILDCIVGAALNAFLLLTLLTSPAMRSDIRNVLIVNVAVADLLVDAFCQPLQVNEAFQRDWVSGCYLHIVVQVIEISAGAFVSTWGIMCLDALLLTRVTRLTHSLTSCLTSSLTTSASLWRRRLEMGVKVAAVAFPWVMSVAVLAPVVVKQLQAGIVLLWTSDRCPIGMTHSVYRLLAVFVSFLPGAVILMLLLVTAIVYFTRRRSGRGLMSFAPPTTPQTISTLESPSGSQPGDPTPSQDPASAYVTASVLTLVLTGAVHVFHVGKLGRTLSLSASLLTSLSLIALYSLKSAVLPFVWLLMLPDVRARARHLLVSGRDTLRRRVNAVPTSLDPSVAYRNLEHD
ncbi:hypothetical protein BaRGS_00009042 [Batillaria attramentaria]|uniref:G-protein coupled receptors family 1 profile domain-containing protein n=1 Tax=Batillaria attramentaria TaxID=370345 RepID=A0ABD0LK82_9CAEN